MILIIQLITIITMIMIQLIDTTTNNIMSMINNDTTYLLRAGKSGPRLQRNESGERDAIQ